MKHKFHFDKSTGTVVPVQSEQPQEPGFEPISVTKSNSSDGVVKPVFKENKAIEVASTKVNVQQMQTVKMRRVDKPTYIQLVGEDDSPEAYLDSSSTGVMMFRELQDYDVCQITDEKTGKVLAYIGGYALQFNFNMAELKTMERVEQCLQGIVKLFRHKIMTQNLAPGAEHD